MAPKSKKRADENDEDSDFRVCEGDIPAQPRNLEVGLDLIYRELTEPYLSSAQCVEFKAICRLALSPEHREDVRARILALYSSNKAFDIEFRERIADAVICLVQAATALHEGDIEAAQTFMEQASAVLPAILKRLGKIAKQEECIKRFAARLHVIRPRSGWESIDQAARAGQAELQKLLKEYKRSFGELWKMDAGTLLMKWLQEKQPDVYAAYQNAPSAKS
jgi:hypothetical protein